MLKILIYLTINIIVVMSTLAQESREITDNSGKSVLARGCDPVASVEFSKVVPPLIGNAEYVPTTDDADFIEKLESRTWSVVFFAPGACRFSAAKQQIPGGNYDTEGWSLDEYKDLVRKLQGNEIQIAETVSESETVNVLNEALSSARETNNE